MKNQMLIRAILYGANCFLIMLKSDLSLIWCVGKALLGTSLVRTRRRVAVRLFHRLGRPDGGANQWRHITKRLYEGQYLEASLYLLSDLPLE
jgi:hypothetical protein